MREAAVSGLVETSRLVEKAQHVPPTGRLLAERVRSEQYRRREREVSVITVSVELNHEEERYRM
jgi:hypothetical protein